MKRFFKILGISIFGCCAFVSLYIGYTFFWSVKFKVGDCITNGATVYLFDSDGPLWSGAYGLTKLPRKGDEIGIAMPREDIENDQWHKIDCPK